MTFFYKHIVRTGLKSVRMTFFYKHIVRTGLKSVRMTFFYKHIVPAGLKSVRMTFFYKHIVPTGLKSVSTNQVTRTKRRTSDKQYFTKSYLAQLVNLIFLYCFEDRIHSTE